MEEHGKEFKSEHGVEFEFQNEALENRYKEFSDQQKKARKDPDL